MHSLPACDILKALPPRASIAAIAFAAVLLLSAAAASELTAPSPAGPMTTPERIAHTAWWPTSAKAASTDYVGAQTCAKCHAEIVDSQQTSQMAHTLRPARDSAILDTQFSQHYTVGPYTYTAGKGKNEASVRVTDGIGSRSAKLDWAFGSGEVGQSYLWKEGDGGFREARFNYFASLRGLGATPGRLHGQPVSVDMALGRQVAPFEAKTCFGCHTTGMSASSALDQTGFTPGVTCEACHGPGAQHVAAMQSDTPTPDHSTHIVNSGKMTPTQSVDFCGACHSTPWDVRLMGATGLQTVRFPAYRLEKSRCWGTSGDTRVTCQSCHDPHAPLEHTPISYDHACLNCHTTTKQIAADTAHPGAACPVAKTGCVTCHMQKYELPEMHAKFTDHMIRVVRPGGTFPD